MDDLNVDGTPINNGEVSEPKFIDNRDVVVDEPDFSNNQGTTVDDGDFSNNQGTEEETAAEYIAKGLDSGEFMSDEDKAKMETYKKVLTVHGKVRLNDSMKWGFIAVLLLLVFAIIVKIIVTNGESIPYELLTILWGGLATNSIVQATAYKVKKYRDALIAASTFELVLTILFAILWILQLCKIIT